MSKIISSDDFKPQPDSNIQNIKKKVLHILPHHINRIEGLSGGWLGCEPCGVCFGIFSGSWRGTTQDISSMPHLHYTFFFLRPPFSSPKNAGSIKICTVQLFVRSTDVLNFGTSGRFFSNRWLKGSRIVARFLSKKNVE